MRDRQNLIFNVALVLCVVLGTMLGTLLGDHFKADTPVTGLVCCPACGKMSMYERKSDTMTVMRPVRVHVQKNAKREVPLR